MRYASAEGIHCARTHNPSLSPAAQLKLQYVNVKSITGCEEREAKWFFLPPLVFVSCSFVPSLLFAGLVS